MDTNAKITATKVPEADKMDFFPKHMGRFLMVGESTIYALMDRLCSDYSGGMWDFYEVSNGSFFVAPQSDQNFNLAWPDNHSNEEVSPVAAGIVATSFALNYLAAKYQDDELIDKYHLLREYMCDHPESQQMLSLTD